ncbi:hypothetical protein G7046_g6269 [Stylonectria norvegica]|nr:hypothetical protein G7046_g6269 [Stylonectria norvegica]
MPLDTSAYQQALAESYRQSTHPMAAQEPFDRLAPTGPAGPGQFGLLAPTRVPDMASEPTLFVPVMPLHQPVEQSNSQLSSRLVVDPPDLQAWREKLFDVDETMVLTHEQFETYFPHVDNVYSHRSTQRYKRKPFISHYWDCRLKGRPPGTPKSDDPNKKKRKRNARARDLCDVKIKITEYFAGAEFDDDDEGAAAAAQSTVGAGQRFWTIQRVNGNGGNGKGDGVAGPHKHTLAKSDEIKKNSVQRFLAKQDKDTKRTSRPALKKATGLALSTVRKHSRESELKLYSSCFCPFSQRVWIALEAKGLPYQYCEADASRVSTLQKAGENPGGGVPVIRHEEWTCAESGVILEYLEDIGQGAPLHPSDLQLKAKCRLWVEHINTRLVPAFYGLLQNQDTSPDLLQASIDAIVHAADETGPFFLGPTLSLVDIHIAPFALRFPRVLAPLRGWHGAVPGSRWRAWLDALEGNVHVQATTSTGELYLETAEVVAQVGRG